MAWTTPGTAVAGDVLTAAFWNEQVRDNMLMGNPVFADEAARDAAIPSPVEGQRCYLTAPTVPAAAGATTFVPTGAQTIYNGSVWVCVTPVSAYNGTQAQTTSTSYTASLTGDSGANPSVTLVTGTTALVSIRSRVVQSGAGSNVFCSFAVSGAGTVAASDSNALFQQGTTDMRYGHTLVVSGLTAGTNTFTMQYKVSANTGSYGFRQITVQGIA